jgi:linoleoyl-CoA desaturase
MYLKTAVILAWWATTYYFLVFTPIPLWAAFPLAISLALAIAGAAFCIQHDGGHNAYSDRNWINRLAAYTLDILGASSYLWRWKHTVFHHTFSNIPGHDPDIELGRVMRLCPQQPRLWYHRWQHIYLFALYGLMAARWHLYGDVYDIATGTTGPNRIPRPKGRDLVLFIVGKAISLTLFLGIPMLFYPWWLVLCFYLFTTGVIGVILSVVFQLAHCVGEADFPPATGDPLRVEAAWAVHQVQTTVDFARGSRLCCWYLGGLNFQIVHHLFPRICHVHYPALSTIVEETCREYGVRYVSHPTFWAGIVSHYRWLREMGRAPVQPATA